MQLSHITSPYSNSGRTNDMYIVSNDFRSEGKTSVLCLREINIDSDLLGLKVTSQSEAHLDINDMS